MNRIFSNYLDWEDYNNGFYNCSVSDDMVDKCFDLLSSPQEFYSVMLDVIDCWKVCTDFNLSNTSFNRRSWLGRVSCNYSFGCGFMNCNIAWHNLNDIQKFNANIKADKIIKLYEKI